MKIVSIIILSIFVSPISLGSEARVNVGIANTGEMKIKGNVNIDVRIAARADDLIAVLKLRANRIEKILKDIYKKESTSYISEFMFLHNKHISLLEVGNFVAAHEILSQIHDLSFIKKIKNERIFRFSYLCSSARYVRGELVVKYVSGDFSVNNFLDSYRNYPLSSEEQLINKKGRGCGPSYIMAKPENINQIYTRVINSIEASDSQKSR